MRVLPLKVLLLTIQFLLSVMETNILEKFVEALGNQQVLQINRVKKNIVVRFDMVAVVQPTVTETATVVR